MSSLKPMSSFKVPHSSNTRMLLTWEPLLVSIYTANLREEDVPPVAFLSSSLVAMRSTNVQCLYMYNHTHMHTYIRIYQCTHMHTCLHLACFEVLCAEQNIRKVWLKTQYSMKWCWVLYCRIKTCPSSVSCMWCHKYDFVVWVLVCPLWQWNYTSTGGHKYCKVGSRTTWLLCNKHTV